MERRQNNYICGHCSTVFESQNLEPRCPKCLRISKIKEADEQFKTSAEQDEDILVESSLSSKERPPPPKHAWLLSLGVAMTTIGLIAGLTLGYTDCRGEDSLGEAVLYALLGGAGLGFVVISLLISKKNKK